MYTYMYICKRNAMYTYTYAYVVMQRNENVVNSLYIYYVQTNSCSSQTLQFREFSLCQSEFITYVSDLCIYLSSLVGYITLTDSCVISTLSCFCLVL